MRDRYSIYVHIPFCRARCSYCAFSSCTDLNLQQRYFDKLFEEIEYYSDKTKPIYTVYLGGGTPSAVGIKYLDALFCKLRTCFDLSGTEEITAECNPESASNAVLACFRRNGVDRLSFGLQSVNDVTLKAIGRLHNYHDFLCAMERARSFDFDNINADLIIGLPESHSDFIHSVLTVAKLPVTHMSLYALELYKASPLYAKLNGKAPFSDDEQADMYDEAVQILSCHNFARYEISNFAKAGKQCLHNLFYWQEGRYFAFGAAASGFVNNTRFNNPWSISDYLSSPVEHLHDGRCEEIDHDEEANEFVMLGLRLESGVSLSEFVARFGVGFWDFFSSANDLRDKGFLVVDGDCVRIPDDKFYVVNSILSELWQNADE